MLSVEPAFVFTPLQSGTYPVEVSVNDAVGAHLDRALPLVVVASPPNSGNSTAPLTGSFNEPFLVATVLVSVCLGVVLIFDYVAIRTLLQNRAKRRR